MNQIGDEVEHLPRRQMTVCDDAMQRLTAGEHPARGHRGGVAAVKGP